MEAQELKTPTLEQVSNYIFYTVENEIESDIDEEIEIVPPFIGPVLVSHGFIEQEDVQELEGEPDWQVTVGEYYIHASDQRKIETYRLIQRVKFKD